jgi:hypothetical protein
METVNYIDLFFLQIQLNISLQKQPHFRDRPFNLEGKGGVMVFCFVQNFFFGQHQYFFFVAINHFGMHCHVSSDVDDVIYPAN